MSTNDDDMIVDESQRPIIVGGTTPQQTDLRFATMVVNGRDYDPEAEMSVSTEPIKPLVIDADVDAQGRPFEVVATLFEVSRDGTTYRTKRYNSKAELVARLKEANTGWAAWADPEPFSKLREAGVVPHDELSAQAQQVVQQKLREAKLREDAFASGYDGYGSDSQSWGNTTYGDGVDVNAEYMPLMAGPWAKQLYQMQYLDMHRKAFEAYNHNPAAHEVINLTTNLLFGRGLDHIATNAQAGEVWSEFVERTDFYDELATIYSDMSWSGEMMMEFHDNQPFKGATDFRMIDPSTVLEIVTDPEDLKEVYYYFQQYSTAMQQYVMQSDIDSIRYIIRQIPADKVYHEKLNVTKYEKRGRSDLFSVLGWLKRLKDLMNARVIKGQLEAAFVWDVEVISGDSNVQNAALNLPDPFKAGSTWVHNKNVQLKPVVGGVKDGNAAGMPDVSAILQLIALGGNIPKEWLGETSRSGRSGSLLSGEIGTKHGERRQRLVEKIIHRVANRVLKNAIAAGILDEDDILRDAKSVMRLGKQSDVVKKRSKAEATYNANNNEAKAQESVGTLRTPMREATADDSEPPLTKEQLARIATIKRTGNYSKELIEVLMPEVVSEDRSAKLKDLALAEAMEWISKRTAATSAAKEFGNTTYDFDAERSAIDDESLDGMSVAHVYGQDNKHVPETVLAQDVQERDTAEQPPASQGMVNVPVPPVVNGMKQEPPQQAASGNSGPKPGTKPNSGDSKVNHAAAVDSSHLDPTAPSDGHSNAARHPMSNEGKKATIKAMRASMLPDIRDQLIREALGPLVYGESKLGSFILQREAKQADDADDTSS